MTVRSLAVLGGVALLMAVACTTVSAKPMNVLFVMYDDLRNIHKTYGGVEAYTPNTNALAAKSLIMDRAFCQQVPS